MSFPFDLHSAAVSDSHLPRHAHAMLRPCRSSQGHGTHVRRETTYGLPARVRLLPATTRSSTKVVIRRIPVSDAGGQCETKNRLSLKRKRMVEAHYKKTICYTLGPAVRIFPAIMRTFTKDTTLSEQGRGAACHV